MSKISMKSFGSKRMTATFRAGLEIFMVAGLGSAALAASGGGGGNSGGGGGNKGVTDAPGVTFTLSPQVSSYNGALPKGTVNLGYAADGTAQSMTFNLAAIKVPDGTVLPVRVIMGKIQTIFTYYALSSVVYSEVDGTIVISHNSATLNLSKLKGDVVPDFPGQNGEGTTEVSIIAPDGSTVLLDGITGSFHP